MLTEFLTHFRNVQPLGTPGHYTATCPAHEDERNSLSISQGEGNKILLNCHVDCPTPQVVSAVGLEMKDLFPDTRAPEQKQRPRVVDVYEYRDETGKVLYCVERTDPKGFRQFSVVPNGEKIYSTKGVRKVLFRLPELIASTGVVFHPAGEKDVNTCVRLGLTATCNAGGENKSAWPEEFAKFFAGRGVVVLADNDGPGLKHAQRIAALIAKYAAWVKVVVFPNHKDVSDWVAAGGTREELERIVESTPTWTAPTETSSADYSIDTAQGQTDLGNARRFVARHHGVIRYCHPWNQWLVFDQKRWSEDTTGAVARLAKQVVDDEWKQVGELEDRKQRGSVVSHLFRSSSRAGIGNALDLAKSEPGIPILPSEMDQDRFLFNCLNGTLELRNGRLRKHDAADKITKLCPTEYIAGATSPVWDAFLESVIPDADVRLFLQRFFGYCLTGLVTEQILVIFWGGGSNGKSTLISAIMETMGSDYAIKADQRLIVGRQNTGHSTERMDVFGKRLVIVSETEDGERLAESTVKDLTGSERVRGRRMRQDTWEFDPSHKLILGSNHKPEIVGNDHAIWRRIRLVPFTERFGREEIPGVQRQGDPLLAEKLASVRPAILAWMVQGCMDWRQNGLPPCDAITAATDEYRSDQDRLAAFIEEECLTLPQVRVRSGDLYDAFTGWCESNGEAPLSQTKFGRRMKEKFRHERSNGAWFLGIGLREKSREEVF